MGLLFPLLSGDLIDTMSSKVHRTSLPTAFSAESVLLRRTFDKCVHTHSRSLSIIVITHNHTPQRNETLSKREQILSVEMHLTLFT